MITNRKKEIATTTFVILFMSLLITISGCGVSNTIVTKENYNKIKAGMTEGEVISILGEPDSKSESDTPGVGHMAMWHYQLGMKAIDVWLINGSVNSKNWTEL